MGRTHGPGGPVIPVPLSPRVVSKDEADYPFSNGNNFSISND